MLVTPLSLPPRRIRSSLMKKRKVERWRDIPGYRGLYQVSDQGKVKSLARSKRKGAGNYARSERILRTPPDPYGYPKVTLSKKGVEKKYFVHRLVLLSFVGECPSGMESCHNDGNPENSWLSNLRYDTPKGNAADKHRHGTINKGSRNGGAKITEDDVVEMRDWYAEGEMTCKQLAEVYGLAASHTSDTLGRRKWSHVGGADCSKMLRRGQGRGGPNPGKSFTSDQIHTIRKHHAEGTTKTALAKKYKVSWVSIHKIINHQTYKYVE